MSNAKKIPCEILYRPQDEKYSERIRNFQGCPTLAVTHGGRIYLGWYSGGTREPHMDNYNLLVYSDDKGKSWSEPLIVIPGSYRYNIHSLDIQIFTDSDGALHVCWVQNNTCPVPDVLPEAKKGQPLVCTDGYMFGDFVHAEWEMICHNPDDSSPAFSEPRYIFPGFLRCKPTQLENGDILYFNYNQTDDRYAYSISHDGGNSFEHHVGAKKLSTCFDEGMAYQKKDGSIRMFARTNLGQLAQSFSYDGGKTWTEAELSGIVAADSRFFVKRLPSGRMMLIYNDAVTRCNMTVALSEDDGSTWKYKKCLDTRNDISYPDADIHDGIIYLSYDRGRNTEREILFASFTEEDIIGGKDIEIKLVSKP